MTDFNHHQNDTQREQRARQYVHALRGFYFHLIVSTAIMSLLFALDWLGGPGWWFFWPLLGWGIGVALHAVAIFGIGGLFGSAWEDRKTREVMEQEAARGR